MTRETAAINAGPGQASRNGHAPACAGEAGAAAAVDSAHDRPRPGQTSRRVIDRAARPDAPAAGSGPTGPPGPARVGTSRHRPMAAALSGPRGRGGRHRVGADDQADAHPAWPAPAAAAGAGRATGVSGGRWRGRGPGGRSG